MGGGWPVEGGRRGPMIREVPGRSPRIHPDAYVDPAAQVIGDVTIEEGASVWPGSVLRGDQDNHVPSGGTRTSRTTPCSTSRRSFPVSSARA
jgi:hypothetical protein